MKLRILFFTLLTISSSMLCMEEGNGSSAYSQEIDVNDPELKAALELSLQTRSNSNSNCNNNNSLVKAENYFDHLPNELLMKIVDWFMIPVINLHAPKDIYQSMRLDIQRFKKTCSRFHQFINDPVFQKFLLNRSINFALYMGAFNRGSSHLDPFENMIVAGGESVFKYDIPMVIFHLLKRYPQLANARDKNGDSLLNRAANANALGIVKLLLKNGLSVDSRTGSITALMAAGRFSGDNSEPMVTFLLDNKANLEALSAIGYTPLMFAVLDDHVNKARLLLERGACVNAKDNFGRTPLMLACNRNNLKMVQLLLDYGADVSDQKFIEPI